MKNIKKWIKIIILMKLIESFEHTKARKVKKKRKIKFKGTNFEGYY